MAKDYKYYNKFAQQDKDSMRTAMHEQSNENEATLIDQTDEVEGLLRTVINRLESLMAYTDTLEAKLQTIIDQTDGLEGGISSVVTNTSNIATYTDQLEAKVDATTTAVGNAQVAIVNAIEALPHDQPV